MLMKKTIAMLGTSALLLFLGLATPTSYAQEQHDDQGKPESAPPKTPDDKAKPAKEKPAKPPKDQPKSEQPKTEKHSQQADKQNEQQKDQQKAEKDQEKAQEKTQKEQQKQVKKSDEQQKQYAQQQNRNEGAQQSNGGGRGRIPDDRFKAHFGREHHFHVGHPQVVEGRPRFSYGGYSFIIVEAWPADWGYDDDVYIIDDGGVYYLCDVARPGVQLELTVVL
jgi:DNA mismatch repair ATPase MutL